MDTLQKENTDIKTGFEDVKACINDVINSTNIIKKENEELRNAIKYLAEQEKQREVVIEVGGDHGDGNVAVVKKSAGVKVTIRDFDNTYLPENYDIQDEPVPEEREWKTDAEV